MIVTLTPNPSVDRTFEVAEFTIGTVSRADAVRIEPGGKGLNVARTLVAGGHGVRAVVPVGGHDGELLSDELADRGVTVVAVPIARPVRTNISLVTPDGVVSKVNAPGPRLTGAEVRALRKATVAELAGAEWLAGCGSLPPGAPADLYATLVREAQAAGVRVAIDASGAALREAVAAGPDLIKPNREELAELAGRELTSFGDVLGAARELIGWGVGAVVASLGADGAVLVDTDGAWHATRPPIVPRSAVGAGDALLAGVLAAGGRGPEALRVGVAHGAAAALLPGTAAPAPSDVDLEAVTVTPVDHHRPLTEGAHR
ncbi:1-phosphofructokinase [Nitriliruptor alkaliphilus]|uniref:1-phosphofructokinase n=1 Tax=Nitriliruptor alkaliphilus TaxID=427918 RepID=UPI0006984F49|nr:1-phosphofructokinase [Nitriliruptor alkaliphilus]